MRGAIGDRERENSRLAKETERGERERTRARPNLPQSRAYVGKLARQSAGSVGNVQENHRKARRFAGWCRVNELYRCARSLNGCKRE